MERNNKPAQQPNKKKGKRSRKNGFEEWGGYLESKKTKLKAQFQNKKQVVVDDEITPTSCIFQGISIYVNGYTNPSAEEIKRMMMLHGGTYHYYYSSHTSHMVATNLPDSKISSLKGRKVVSPEWITDSIKAGKLLPDCDYMLYTPEVVDRQQRLQLPKVNNQNLSIPVQKTVATEVTPNSTVHSAVLNSSTDSTLMSNCEGSFTGQRNANTATNVNRTITSESSVNKNLAIKAGHPDFVSEFYNHSRLHHIATAGQELKAYVQQLASEQKGKPFLGREKLRQRKLRSPQKFVADTSTNSKTIMHLDMDCFFVSVGLRNHPELKGQPVAVTHSKGKRGAPTEGSNVEYEANYYFNKLHQHKERLEDDEDIDNPPTISKPLSNHGSLSEIASCSYEARQAGIKNGMFLGKALQLCPNLKTIPYDFEGYSEASKLLYDTVASYTLDIEAVSCDELYIDCTEILQDVQISATEFACILRNELFEKTKCTASAGIGENMLLARLATKIAKPNGQSILSDDQVEEFMKKQLVNQLPGVGYSTTAKLKQFNIKTCGDLQNWNLKRLQQEFGPKTGQTLYEHCRGIDHKNVTLEKDRKSVSAEINYGIRFQEEEEIYNFINELAVEIEQRLKKIDRRGRSLSLKLRIRKEDSPMETAKFMGHGVCDSVCKSTALKVATDDAKVIGTECCSIAKALKIPPQDYRGLGIQMSKLESSAKDPSINTIDHFLAKISVGSKNHEKDPTSQLMQVPSASSSSINSGDQTNVHSRQVTSTLNHNNQENKGTAHSNTPAQFSQSAYYAQVSQLDQSVLDALPEDLRQELLSAHQRRRVSPKKVLSPSKTNKPSSSKKGRPAGSKAKKGKTNNTSPQKTMKDYQKVTVPKDDTSSSIITPPITTVSDKKKASLGGATDLDEVRELIKEWMSTTEEPIEVDNDHLKTYLLSLVEEDLEKTDLVLKHFHRLASSATQCWKDSYFLILSYVQQKMLQDFGYMLKARDSF